MRIGRAAWTLLLSFIALSAALPAAGQRRAGPPRSEPGLRTMQAGLAAGWAGVDVRRPGSSWDAGLLIGARWRWAGARSGAFVALDLQPFLVDAGDPAGYRAAWLLPAYEVRTGGARIRVGLGLGIFRFERAALGGRTDFTTITGVSASIRMPASFALEPGWRRTGLLRGFRSDIWSLQLARYWPL